MAKEVIGPVLEGRTAQAGFKPFEIYRKINISVPLPPIPILSPAGPWPRITWFPKTLEILRKIKVLGHCCPPKPMTYIMYPNPKNREACML